jgi:O-antigen/teichoic acid export membrane protein
MKNKKVTTDILFGFFTQVAIRFRGILFIPLISINLGVAAFGAYTQLLAVVTLAITVVELGLHQALIRYGRRTDDIADLYYSLLVVVLLSASVAAVVMGE